MKGMKGMKECLVFVSGGRWEGRLRALRSEELRVEGLPTFLFFRGGKQVYRLDGAPPPGELEKLVAQHLGVQV